ncbi:MAG TPA: 3'-5' exonuclease [Bacilli bacterium]|nr:3'-5' exonuclease [Bacilli bacterium]
MKKLYNQVRHSKQLIFLDLEGTQFTHELIAIGALKVTLTRKGTIKRRGDTLKMYVKPKNSIGRYVVQLTGITKEILENEGLPFDVVLERFKKFIGRNISKTKYVTFGAHDMRILRQSAKYTPEADHEFIKTIGKRTVDLSAIINEYVKDGKNTYSLTNLCKLFEVPLIEPAHDPLNDALMLAGLYDSLFKNTDLIVGKYREMLLGLTKIPRPYKKLIQKIVKEGQATSDDFEKFIREEIE